MRLPLPRLLLIVLVTLFASNIAWAEDGETRAAKRYFARGEKLFALGKFDEALDEYQKAYDAKPIPDFLFNIGQCHRNLGDYEAAIFSYKKFLKLDPEAPNRDQVEQLIADLEEKQEREGSRKFGFERKKKKQPDEETSSPVYTKWWFWTGVVVVGVAGGVGAYAATRPDGPPETTLGNIVFTK